LFEFEARTMPNFVSLALAAVVVKSQADLCPGAFHGTPPLDSDKAPNATTYNNALRALDIHAVMSDLESLFVNSQECWPADDGNYGPFFIRLAWHCSGSYRATDGRGGCAGGRQRFEPERSWADNTNLDKARALLWPIKEKYGDGLSWGDLFTLAGTTAIHSMGGPVTQYCAGRIDSEDGEESLILGPSNEQERMAPCEVNGDCQRPLGSTTVGLIYLNPEGPVRQKSDGTWGPDPDPSLSAFDVRDAFARMGMDDTETVALIGGGHAFGKTHGACPMGAGPSPADQPLNPWPGACGTGTGEDAFTSGFEGPWTTKPNQYDDEFFHLMLNSTWEKIIGPGGHWQWRIQGATGPLAGVMRLTSDLSLLHDSAYLDIVKNFAAEPSRFNEAFDKAWFKLTTAGGYWSAERKCVSPSVGSSSMRSDDVVV
jgi:catalase-peroxidase